MGAVHEFQGQGKKRKAVAKEEWERSKRKINRQLGNVYTSTMNLDVRARRVKEKDCSKCARKFTTNFSEHNRHSIHKAYWAVGNTELS
jgi:hypothetical protein